MKDYLDEDVAYLIGLIIGRGEIYESDDKFIVRFEFPFHKPKLEGYDQFSGFIASMASKILPRLRKLLGNNVEMSVIEKQQITAFKIELGKWNLISRNIKLILGTSEYKNFKIPDVIAKNSNQQIKLEFMRGFADIAGNIRRSNRDQNGRHRVYLDVLNQNWKLPVQICNLLQNSLDVPVQSIIWAHPDLRGDATPREHQIRVFAQEFLKIGFYIEHKQKVLEQLSNENKKFKAKFCEGKPRRKRKIKPQKNTERNEYLPQNLRKHFNSFQEICADMGCEIAIKALKKESKK